MLTCQYESIPLCSEHSPADRVRREGIVQRVEIAIPWCMFVQINGNSAKSDWAPLWGTGIRVVNWSFLWEASVLKGRSWLFLRWYCVEKLNTKQNCCVVLQALCNSSKTCFSYFSWTITSISKLLFRVAIIQEKKTQTPEACGGSRRAFSQLPHKEHLWKESWALVLSQNCDNYFL